VRLFGYFKRNCIKSNKSQTKWAELQIPLVVKYAWLRRQWRDSQSLQGIRRRSWISVESKMCSFFLFNAAGELISERGKNKYEIRRMIKLAAFKHKYYSSLWRVIDNIIFSPEYKGNFHLIDWVACRFSIWNVIRGWMEALKKNSMYLKVLSKPKLCAFSTHHFLNHSLRFSIFF
jgi:hypothetical protein